MHLVETKSDLEGLARSVFQWLKYTEISHSFELRVIARDANDLFRSS